MKWSTWLLASVALLAPRASYGQVVVSTQALDFGELIAGVTEVVSTTDVVRRAAIALQGSSNGDVSVSLVLPSQLMSPDGQVIPLQFLPGDAVYRSFNGQQQPLNLTGPTAVKLHRSQTTNVYLGGRALPSVGQRAGIYSATVVVVIAPPGA